MADWFKMQAVVTDSDCGADGIMRLDAWFQLFQWIAVQHNTALGCDHDGLLPKSVVWVLLGAHAHWRRPVRVGERLVIETAPSASSHGMFQRRIKITDDNGNEVAGNVGFWTLLDYETRRITRCEAIQKRHGETEIGPGARPVPFAAIEGADVGAWAYTPSGIDIDDNGHVNNARYIAWLGDALRGRDGGTPTLQTLDAWYASEVLPGERLTGRVARATDGRFTFEAFRSGSEKACFTASGQANRTI
ncbi:hypothetical protein FACS1894184_01870 [Clostridia bacterium]|nr:hypothetical protein FACS1894184_01870 [Clostridia bacterium]